MGFLVPVQNVSAYRLVFSERSNYFKNISAKCCFTEKFEFFKVVGALQEDIEKFIKKCKGVS